jgi:general secretion pathway protein C
MAFDMLQRFIQIANLLLITAAVFLSVKLFYQFVAFRLVYPVSAITSAGPQPVARGDKSRPSFENYRVIVDRDLFDTSDKAEERPPKSEMDLETLEKTKLNLKLWGTVAADVDKSITARAVIEDVTVRRQGLYQIGDTIQHATISEIFRNSVVLDVNGKKEKLSIEEKDGFPSIDATKAAMSRPEQEELPQIKTERQISLKRSRVNEALNNINQLMSEVKIRPYFQDGEPAGFIVSSISPDSVVRDMGLKTGDIVTGINGQDIQTADDAMAFYQKLQAGEAISLELQRRGRRESINYVLEGEEVKQ